MKPSFSQKRNASAKLTRSGARDAAVLEASIALLPEKKLIAELGRAAVLAAPGARAPT
jgi:hypothetical protein